MNKWYVIGKEDKNSKYGYTQITPKGIYYNNLKEVKIARKQLEVNFNKKYVIFRRTCDVIK